MQSVSEILRGHEKQSLLPSRKLLPSKDTDPLGPALGSVIEHLPRQTPEKFKSL